MRHLNEDELILSYYGETEEVHEFSQHLTSCPSCRSRLDDIKNMLALVDALEVPERSAGYGAEVWDRLRHRLPTQRSGWLGFLSHPPRWALAGALATLVIAAFTLGRYWPVPGPEPGPVDLPA